MQELTAAGLDATLVRSAAEVLTEVALAKDLPPFLTLVALPRLDQPAAS